MFRKTWHRRIHTAAKQNEGIDRRSNVKKNNKNEKIKSNNTLFTDRVEFRE